MYLNKKIPKILLQNTALLGGKINISETNKSFLQSPSKSFRLYYEGFALRGHSEPYDKIFKEGFSKRKNLNTEKNAALAYGYNSEQVGITLSYGISCTTNINIAKDYSFLSSKRNKYQYNFVFLIDARSFNGIVIPRVQQNILKIANPFPPGIINEINYVNDIPSESIVGVFDMNSNKYDSLILNKYYTPTHKSCYFGRERNLSELIELINTYSSDRMQKMHKEYLNSKLHNHKYRYYDFQESSEFLERTKKSWFQKFF
ncbi:hypothetical protein [Spirobacillus cienkowskii]|uniref:hypothetical protein n=1 Tax=Spirobacillus cienkowskii TaxID=495820 RepID=UPI0030D17945